MSFTFVRRIALAALALPLLLGGCADDEPEPKVPATSSPTSPVAETNTTPEAWHEQTEDGAVAYAEHWIELLNGARLASETEPLAEASTPECGTCSNYVRLINKWRSNGTTYESKPWTIEQVGVIASEHESVQLALRIFRPMEVITQSDGREERNKGTRATYSATFRWFQGGWRMHELVIPE